MSSDQHTPQSYTVSEVARLTGISSHALRIWERRFGFPAPERNHAGHRRYSPTSVAQIQRIAALLNSGHPIRDVIPPSPLDLDPTPYPLPNDLPLLIDHLASGDFQAAESVYQSLSTGRDSRLLVLEILAPALVETGELWFRGHCDAYQERLISGYVRRKLALLLQEAQHLNQSPKGLVIVGTPEGDNHEGGVLALSILLELAGWRAFNLGTGLPVSEYQKAVNSWSPHALCISFVLARKISAQLEALSLLTGPPVYVGGRSIVNHARKARELGLHPIVAPIGEAVAYLLEAFESQPVKSHPTTK